MTTDTITCVGCNKDTNLDTRETLSPYQSFWLQYDYRCPDCVQGMNDYEAIWAFLENFRTFEHLQLLLECFHLTRREASLLRDLRKVQTPEVIDFIQGLVPESSIRVRDWRKENEIVK